MFLLPKHVIWSNTNSRDTDRTYVDKGKFLDFYLFFFLKLSFPSSPQDSGPRLTSSGSG